MKPSTQSCVFGISGALVIIVAGASFLYATVTGESLAWQIAIIGSLLGVPSFLYGEHLRKKYLGKRPLI